jgi:hypothetical protein
MATNRAIAATSAAISTLLEAEALKDTQLPRCTVSLYQAEQLQKPAEGVVISVYLYRINISVVRRDQGLRTAVDGTYLASIPLDLHYLVTAWSSSADTAQRLLGWAVSVLNDTPVIPTSLLNTFPDETPVFGDQEQVELVWEPLSLTDLYDVWQVAAQRAAPSASYLARAVRIDSQVRVDGGGLVRERNLELAKGPS